MFLLKRNNLFAFKDLFLCFSEKKQTLEPLAKGKYPKTRSVKKKLRAKTGALEAGRCRIIVEYKVALIPSHRNITILCFIFYWAQVLTSAGGFYYEYLYIILK